MLDPKLFYRSDPLLSLLWLMTKGKQIWVAFFALLMCGGLCFGLGTALTSSHATSILNPLQAQTFPLEAFIYFLTLPTIWVYYVREPEKIQAIFAGLVRNQVLERKSQTSLSIEDFFKKQRTLFESRWQAVFACGLTLSIFLLWASSVFTPHNPFWFAHASTWWEFNPWFFWFVWVPVVWATVYMLWLIFLRRALVVVLLARFFREFVLSPRLFHPDHANGCGSIGDYPLNFSFLVLVSGAWVFLVITYPSFFGGPMNLKYDTIAYGLLYTILTAVGFFAPIWRTHKLMCEAKHQALEQIAGEIARLLFQMRLDPAKNSPVLSARPASPSVQENMEKIDALEREYKLFERESKTWPFNLTSLNQFLLSFGFPLFSTGVSVVLTLVKK